MGRRVDINTLLVRWDAHEQDFKAWFPNQCDGGFAIGHLCGDIICVGQPGFKNSFAKELESRGYDLSTLRFSIKRKTS